MKKAIKKVPKKRDVTLNEVAATLDNLAIMVHKGFVAQDKNLHDFKKEMYEFRDEMYEFKQKTELNFMTLDSKIESVDRRLQKVEESLEPILLTYGVFSREIRDLNSRMVRLEKKVGVK